jgi:hypothetical protein
MDRHEKPLVPPVALRAPGGIAALTSFVPCTSARSAARNKALHLAARPSSLRLAEELQINKDYALRQVKKMVPELDLKLHYGRRNALSLSREDLPTRLKIGYTDNLDVRQSDHRTSAPTLLLIKSWPCRRTWEEAARASITREDCRCIGGEVFDGDVQGFVERAEAFFSIMPSPSVSPSATANDSLS